MKRKDSDQRVEVDLRGSARKGGHRGIGDIEIGFGRFENRRRLNARRVVRVEVDRNADFLLERFDELLSRVGFAEPGHILDGQDVGAHLFQLFGERDVIVEIVFGAAAVEDVAGVANGRFADRPALLDRLHGHPHVGDPIERIENAKQIDAGPGRLADELFDDVVRIVRIADGVGAA